MFPLKTLLKFVFKMVIMADVSYGCCDIMIRA